MNRSVKYHIAKKRKTARKTDTQRYKANKRANIDINESMNELSTNTSVSFINTIFPKITELTLFVILLKFIKIDISIHATNFQKIAFSHVKRRHESHFLTTTVSSSSTIFQKFEFATRSTSRQFRFFFQTYVENPEVVSLSIQTLSLTSFKKSRTSKQSLIIIDNKQHDVESNFVSTNSFDSRDRISIANKSITTFFLKTMFLHVSNVNTSTINFSETFTVIDASILVEIAFLFNAAISQRIFLSFRRQSASAQLVMSFSRVKNQSFLSSSSSTARSRFESSTMQNSSIQFSEQSEQFSFSLIYIDFDSFFLFQTFFSFSSESEEDAKSKHSDHLNNDVQKGNSSHLSNDNSIVNQSTTDILHETSRLFCVCDELIHDRRANRTIANEVVQIASLQKRASFQKRKKQMLSRS